MLNTGSADAGGGISTGGVGVGAGSGVVLGAGLSPASFCVVTSNLMVPFAGGGVSWGAGTSCGVWVACGADVAWETWAVCGAGVGDGSAGSSSFTGFSPSSLAVLSCASGALPAEKEMASLSTAPVGSAEGASVISTVGWGG